MKSRFSTALTASFLTLFMLGVGSNVSVHAETWVQSGFDAFRGGRAEDGGANLYVTAEGLIRSIYTFDYNRDGANDVMFVQSHNSSDAPPTYIYMNSEQGLRPQYLWQLLNDGAQSGLVADLNDDGRMDVVVCGSDNGMNGIPLDAIIYYGAERGFEPLSSQRLPTFLSRSVVCADLNGDGYKDLAFAQDMRLAPEQVFVAEFGLLIYWNSKSGFAPERRLELPCPPSHCTATADFNEDGYADLVVLAKKKNQLTVFLGAADGIQPERKIIQYLEAAGNSQRFAAADVDSDGHVDLVLANTADQGMSCVFRGQGNGQFDEQPLVQLPTSGASACVVDDLNGDGHTDIVFANSAAPASVIYWGDKSGWSLENRQLLPTSFAGGCAVGDINADGVKDLVFANQKDLLTRDIDSFVYWGAKEGYRSDNVLRLPTHGPQDVLIADVNEDQRPEVIFFNAKDGTASYAYSKIYWNDGKGNFSDERVQAFETWSSWYHVAADLNRDGYLDIVFSQSYEESRERNQGSVIYWGDRAGWSDDRNTLLKTSGSAAVVCADLNRDGFLDLVFSEVTAWLPPDAPKASRIYWGGKEGFNEENQSALPAGDARGLTLADFNKDGWLDIVITNLAEPVLVYLGSSEGYSEDRCWELPPANGSVAASVADFDNDGWLDLVVSRYYDELFRVATYSHIYYGSAQGFNLERTVLLPTSAADQPTIADFNQDGFLDFFVGTYATGGKDRTWSSYLYWGSADGFSPIRRRELITDSGSGSVALDFNKDGWIDLAVANHKKPNGDHRADSRIFYNSPSGFSDYRKTLLRTDGAHEITAMDPGNIYDRKYELGYVSSIFDAGEPSPFKELRWQGKTPLGSTLEFEIRASNSLDGFSSSPWHKADEASKRGMTGRFVQYRVVFISADGSNYPELKEVAIDFD